MRRARRQGFGIGWRSTAWTWLLASALLAPTAIQAQSLVATVPVGPQPAFTMATARAMVLNPINHKIYISGDAGVISVVDGLSNTTLTHIQPPPGGGAVGLMIVNPQANVIYVDVGSMIFTIDSAADTITHSVTPPPSTDFPQFGFAGFNSMQYNPSTNKLYVEQSKTVAGGPTGAETAYEWVLRDPVTLEELTVLASEPFGDPGCTADAINDPPTIPGALLFNPATNKYYGIHGAACANTWLFVIDGNTDAVIEETHVVSNQLTYFIPGSWTGWVLNPVDNSVWATSNCSGAQQIIAGDDVHHAHRRRHQSAVDRLRLRPIFRPGIRREERPDHRPGDVPSRNGQLRHAIHIRDVRYRDIRSGQRDAESGHRPQPGRVSQCSRVVRRHVSARRRYSDRHVLLRRLQRSIARSCRARRLRRRTDGDDAAVSAGPMAHPTADASERHPPRADGGRSVHR